MDYILPSERWQEESADQVEPMDLSIGSENAAGPSNIQEYPLDLSTRNQSETSSSSPSSPASVNFRLKIERLNRIIE